MRYSVYTRYIYVYIKLSSWSKTRCWNVTYVGRVMQTMTRNYSRMSYSLFTWLRKEEKKKTISRKFPKTRNEVRLNCHSPQNSYYLYEMFNCCWNSIYSTDPLRSEAEQLPLWCSVRWSENWNMNIWTSFLLSFHLTQLGEVDSMIFFFFSYLKVLDPVGINRMTIFDDDVRVDLIVINQDYLFLHRVRK
jgi:hypothetical protein